MILVFNQNMKAQYSKLLEVETNSIKDLNAEQAWKMVNDWAKLNTLVPEVVATTKVNGKGVNASWDIVLVNGGLISEEMIYYDDNGKTMSYSMTKTPMPISDYVAIIKVEPYGITKSLVSFYTRCNTSEKDYDFIKSTFESFQKTYLSNLKQ